VNIYEAADLIAHTELGFNSEEIRRHYGSVAAMLRCVGFETDKGRGYIIFSWKSKTGKTELIEWS
jgi:hypothetical protein